MPIILMITIRFFFRKRGGQTLN